MLVDQDKYSAALQKFLGYNKEEADFVACNYNNKAKQGLVEPLLCYPDPDAFFDGTTLHLPNGKIFNNVDYHSIKKLGS